MSYALCLAAGVGMVVWSPLIIVHAIGGPITDAVGWVVIVSSLICLNSQLRLRWRQEWVSLWFLGAGVSAYALIAWDLTVVQWPGRMVEACMATVIAVQIAGRIHQLSRLDAETKWAKIQGGVARALGGRAPDVR